MFNKVNMSNTAGEKLSATKSIGFRPDAKMRQDIEDLVASTQGRWKISDVARVTFTTFWPQIKAIVQSTNTPPVDEASCAALREKLALCDAVQARGLDLKAILTAALSAQVEAATPAPASTDQAA